MIKPEKAEMWIKKALVFSLFLLMINFLYTTLVCKYISIRRYYATHSTVFNIFLTFELAIFLIEDECRLLKEKRLRGFVISKTKFVKN